MNADKSSLSKSLTSQVRFLTGRSFLEEKKDYNPERSKIFDPFNELLHMNDEPEICQDRLSDIAPEDLGNFNITGNKHDDRIKFYDGDRETQRSREGLIDIIEKHVNQEHEMRIKTNLLRHLNPSLDNEEDAGSIGIERRTLLELWAHFSRESENDYQMLAVPDPVMLEKAQGNKISPNKTKTLVDDCLEERDKFEIRNTENSLVIRKQKRQIRQGEFEKALDINYDYLLMKERYEVSLVLSLKRKMDEYEGQGSSKTVVIASPEPYTKLKDFYKKYLEVPFEAGIRKDGDLGTSKYIPIPDVQEQQMKTKSILCLSEFIAGIEKAIDDNPQDDKGGIERGKKLNIYIFWKKKLSELVNIWELSKSNGLPLRFPIKYLMLKKYFSLRAEKRQAGIGSGGIMDDAPPIYEIIIKDLLGVKKNSNVPKSIFMPGELISILFELIIALLLLYSIFSIPLIQFIGYSTYEMLVIEKFVDMVFYIEIITKFRKVFRDKSNNFVYDIDQMLYNYMRGTFLIDFLSTIPWYFFWLDDIGSFNTAKKWVMCFKIVRIFKIFPFLSYIESMKGANYVRLFKLVFMFFFFDHWMGSILYAYIDNSISYGGMISQCYFTNTSTEKDNLVYMCRYLLTLYDAAYIIPGQYPSNMNAYVQLNSSTEYVLLIFLYMIGQVLAAYIFGGMASVVQNLNQGQNFFTDKMDMLTEHMMFYDVNIHTMKDVKIYFDYMWQRHKDVIYGKYHFDLLSNSLREKFERLNLPGNEYLLAQFYQLTTGNNKLIGNILMNLNKVILFPYEILFEKGSVIKGIYIILNGDVDLNDGKSSGDAPKGEKEIKKEFVEYAEVLSLVERDTKNDPKSKQKNINPERRLDKSIIFPLISALIKTGRIYQRCFSEHFTDLLFLPIKAFDDMIYFFPKEMHILKDQKMKEAKNTAFFENAEIMKIITSHSSRSVGKYYEKTYTEENIWVPIPIPISQRKISTDYVKSFTKKVRNQWREILTHGDLSICLNSIAVGPLLTKDREMKSDEKMKGGKIEFIKGTSMEIEKKSKELLSCFRYVNK